METCKRSVTVYGQEIRFAETGTATEVALLLHAAGSNRSEWDSVTESLASQYRVIAPDLPGHGASAKPMLNYRLTTYADFIAGFCDALGVKKIALLAGHSASGAAAVLLALRRPELIESLVLIDSGYGYALPHVEDPRQLGHNPGTLRLLNPATRDEARELLSLAVAGTFSEEQVDQLWTSQMNSAWAMQKLIDSWTRRDDTIDGKLAGLRTPTLILWGAEDRITPPNLGERMQREIPNSQLVIAPGCGHSVHLEDPEFFLNSVSAFLQRR